MPVVPRGERSFFGPGMIGQALAHAGGLVPTVERLGATVPAKSIGPTTTTSVGGVVTYEIVEAGAGATLSVPSGTYVVDAYYSITFDADVTDLYAAISVAVDSLDTPPIPGGPAAPAGFPLGSETHGGVIVVTATDITATVTLSGGGGAGTTAEQTTIRATRIAEA